MPFGGEGAAPTGPQPPFRRRGLPPRIASGALFREVCLPPFLHWHREREDGGRIQQLWPRGWLKVSLEMVRHPAEWGRMSPLTQVSFGMK